MMRWVIAGVVLLTCCTIPRADESIDISGRQMSVDYELNFHTGVNEKVHLRLNASGTTDSPVRTELTEYHHSRNLRIELETDIIPGLNPHFKTKISISEKYGDGGENIILRPQVRGVTNSPTRLKINDNEISVAVTIAKQNSW